MSIHDFQVGTRIVHGPGAVDRLGELVDGLGVRTVLLVTDPGIVQAGHVERACTALEDAGLTVTVFDQVHENPTTDDVDAVVAVAEDVQPDGIVALGGGSSLDAAKGCNFLFTNGGRMQEYWGRGKATKPMLPLVAVPTTTGTGSEMQSFALISDAATKQKMACGDPKALPRIAILDPTLTPSQPHFVIACSGLDTIAHAVETAVTNAGTPISRAFSREAFRLAERAFPRLLDGDDDPDAHGDMLLAAAFGGLAIENSMLGAAHSMSNPLTAAFGIVHGQAVGMMLPHVVRFNATDPATDALYADLATSAGLGGTAGLLARLDELYASTRLPATLDACGVPQSAIESLAAGASKQWTAQFNPLLVNADDFESLYGQAFAQNKPHPQDQHRNSPRRAAEGRGDRNGVTSSTS